MNAIPTLAIAKERGKRMWNLHSFKHLPFKGKSVEEDEDSEYGRIVI